MFLILFATDVFVFDWVSQLKRSKLIMKMKKVCKEKNDFFRTKQREFFRKEC